MCPYLRNSYVRIAFISYDQDGNEVGSVLSENYLNAECQREKCGVWYDGKCNYKIEEKK